MKKFVSCKDVMEKMALSICIILQLFSVFMFSLFLYHLASLNPISSINASSYFIISGHAPSEGLPGGAYNFKIICCKFFIKIFHFKCYMRYCFYNFRQITVFLKSHPFYTERTSVKTCYIKLEFRE